MALIWERCPGCGASLRVPSGPWIGECPECGAAVGRVSRGRRRNPGRAQKGGRDTGHQSEAARKYEAFHQSPPASVTNMPNVTLPVDWWALGSMTREAHIQYVPPRNSRLAGNIMDHAWGDKGGSVQTPGARLYASADGKYLLIINRGKGRFQVTDRGIVG